MADTKLHLSAEELALMQNSAWILTKNRIIEKVCLQFSLVSQQMQQEMGRKAPSAAEHLVWKGPKISRGEKYEGLPYVMLDYPRIFEKEHTFAIRTFFWWGNFCSMTLHVKGRYMAPVLEHVQTTTAINGLPLYISVSGNEWNHNVNSSDYFTNTGEDLWPNPEGWGAPAFVKVAVRIGFGQWSEMESILADAFPALLRLAGI